MADINEKMLFHYLHNTVYAQDDQNAIGATTSTTLRTIKNPTGAATKYVKKFGNAYTITDITAGVIATPRSDGGGVNKWWYEFYDFDTHTLMATLKDENGASAFVDGAALAAPASGVYVKIVWKSGTATPINNDALTVDTDIDPGGRSFRLSTESITAGEMLLYFAYNSSSYYMNDINDQSAKYGGYRTAGAGSIRKPYYNIQDAINALGGAFDNVTVLDSETYDEQPNCNAATALIQAALGQAPTITSGVGARITREVTAQYNNLTARYFNENGDDATGDGTWQNPYLTIGVAYTVKNSAKALVYGGTNTGGVGVFTEYVTSGVAGLWKFTLEADYGYIPTLKWATGSYCIYLGPQPGHSYLYGFIIDGLNMAYYGYSSNPGNSTMETKNTTFRNFLGSTFAPFTGGAIEKAISAPYTLNVEQCFIENSRHGIRILQIDGTDNINNNIFNNNTDNIVFYVTGAGGATVVTLAIENNLFYNTLVTSLALFSAGAFTFDMNGDIKNNTFINGTWGINIDGTIGATSDVAGLTIENNIFKDINEAGAYGIECDVAITIDYNDFYGNTSDYNGNVTSNNELLVDPIFCKITSAYKYGLSSDSPCYRTDKNSDDFGAHFRIIEYNASTVEVNGFIIDGQGFYNNGAYIADDVNHVGCSLKWCSVYNFQGISVDPYDDDTDTDFTISNCKIYNNGNGIKLSYGGNTVEENLIYNNTIYGIWADWTGQNFNHNVFYGNQYGLYIESNSSGILIKNSIFQGNSLFAIFSEINLSITYCCIPDSDAVNNVDITDASNTTDDPLFVDVLSTDKDFHIKTTEGGAIHESPCIDSADDDKDIGAYDVLRYVESESRKKYQLESNPFKMDPIKKIKGNIDINNAIGNLKRFALSKKRVFPLKYANDDYQTEEQIETLGFLSTLIPGIGGLKESECEILLHLLPDQKLFIGKSGTIDAVAKTIDDAAQTWTRDQYRGFWTAVKFTSGANLVIDATLKTGTKAGAGWTVNEWTGYYFYHNYNYYYILSNTASVLTLSDPDDTLLDETAATYAIEKYFKILQNTKNEILLDDPDGGLITGSYDYNIDYIKVIATNKPFQPKQDSGFRYQRHWQKTGFSNTFEES